MDITFSQGIEGFILDKQVAGVSPYTIRNYRLDLKRFSRFLTPENPPIRGVSPDHIRRFIHHLQTTQVVPNGIAPRPPQHLSPKTIKNTHTTLSSYWSWAVVEGYADRNIAMEVRPPKPDEPEIVPFCQEQVQALLIVICRSGRPTILRLRDKAIALFLLDTGVRATELCSLTIANVDLKLGTALVVGKSRRNSGRGKQRAVYFGTNTRKALWQYLTTRDAEPNDLLFVTMQGGEIDRRHLCTHLRRLGRRARLADVHTHRFRHTFAITYLRNGGDIFTLH